MPTKEEIEAAAKALDWRLIKVITFEELREMARVALEAAEQVRNGVIQSVKHDNHPDWTHPLIREDRPE